MGTCNFRLQSFKSNKILNNTYIVKCSSHFGLLVFLQTSVFLGGCASTLSSTNESGREEKRPPDPESLAD